MGHESYSEIPLKAVAGPPWRWWLGAISCLLASLALWVISRYIDAIPDASDVAIAVPVDPDRPETLLMAGGRPDALVEVEPTAEAKSVLFPDAITNLFEATPVETAEHPLDPALAVAHLGLERLASISDYTATITKRERIGTEIRGPETMEAKIRRRRAMADGGQSGFAVYLRFVAPKSVAGREVIWDELRNDAKLVAHEAGFLGMVTVKLEPTSRLAMNNNRYPITEIGFDTLIRRMIEKGERDRRLGICRVEVKRWVVLDGRPCTSITIIHDEKHPEFDFHRATIVIDDELNLPVKYAAYDWPISTGGEPVLLEEYTYRNVKLDVGLTEFDFDSENPEYSYP